MPCQPCISGRSLPIASPGYVVSTETNEQGDGRPSSLIGPRLVKCPLKNSCYGGPANECSPGHTGLRCGTCLDGFSDHGTAGCVTCPSDNVANFTGFLMILVPFILTLIMIDISCRRQYIGALAVLDFLLDALFILSRIGIDWPDMLRGAFSIAALFNFDVTLFSPECSDIGAFVNDREAKLLLAILLPFIFAGLHLLILGVFRTLRVLGLFTPLVDKITPLDDKPVDDKPVDNETDATISAKIKPQLSQLDIPTDDQDDTTYVRQGLFLLGTADLSVCFKILFASMLRFMVVLYPALTVSSLTFFQCVETEDDRSYVFSIPDLDCYSSTWRQLAWLPGLGIAVWVISFPLVTYGHIWKHRHTLADVEAPVFEWFWPLLVEFTPQGWFWGFLEMTIITTTMGAIVSLQNPIEQAIAVQLIFMLHFLLCARIFPFGSNIENAMQVVIGQGLILLVGLGIISHGGSETTRNVCDGIGVFVIIVLLLCVALALYFDVSQIIAFVSKKTLWGAKLLEKLDDKIADTHQPILEQMLHMERTPAGTPRLTPMSVPGRTHLRNMGMSTPMRKTPIDAPNDPAWPKPRNLDQELNASTDLTETDVAALRAMGSSSGQLRRSFTLERQDSLKRKQNVRLRPHTPASRRAAALAEANKQQGSFTERSVEQHDDMAITNLSPKSLPPNHQPTYPSPNPASPHLSTILSSGGTTPKPDLDDDAAGVATNGGPAGFTVIPILAAAPAVANP
eukprot:CAMPEP_0175819748 /NCGR_PEP_ID=MMETSP0107_2-20121207/8234_1 /TAXON_ID=195067 ORGANISM="Goniomonas pacifica, Strain CCMP1869" /NCGR_SAMPLE_ID=MMETSP0107_2 /ASSEMBLY_ACC=CAM_ASM_000203 /LENGTH=737 /DNA_ID=CAMNT_0017132015 /DNA_START=1 /DNA_END=2214 /DNA_ORIENTATION=+